MKSILLSLLCFIPFCLQANIPDDPLLNEAIVLQNSKGTVYEMLDIISDVSGVLFVYNANTLENNRKAKLKKGKTTLKQAILDVIQNPNLRMKVIDNHIMLYIEKSETIKPSYPEKTDTTQISFITIEGQIKDQDTFDPLPYSSVFLKGSGIGTVANQNGEFALKIPNSLIDQSIQFSYVGYETKEIPVELLINEHFDIFLQVKLISIQEIVIKIVNPLKIVNDMLDSRDENYLSEPAYFTTFYREGVDYKNGFVNLTEAIFNIYKQPFSSSKRDQVKLLKMRKISNQDINDSILLKLKAGIDASLTLDVIKNLPSFLDTDKEHLYNYAKISMTTVDSKLAHVITFKQKTEINDPYYQGELYIAADNSALLSARFEINPQHIKKAKKNLVVKQSKGLEISPKSATYTVSFKELDGKYYLYYIRGDLSFSVKKKTWFFNRSNTINSFFEMVTSKIDTKNVKPFPSKESLPANKIFSDIRYSYDSKFWDNFNVILPEKKLSEEIERISSKIEESF